MEIERKFLITELPEHLETYPKQQIEQAYLSRNPVVRVRKLNDSYVLTCKGDGLMVRQEQEIPLSREAYLRLLPKIEGRIIAKTRHVIPYEDSMIELDVFDAPMAPLCIAEVEFSSEEEATAFVPPEWFGQEVTFDPAYTNAALSKKKENAEHGIRPGRYRHFKGNEYEVLYVARHSETEEPVVVYRAMYGDRAVWVRPAAMWTEEVLYQGKTVPRFCYIGDAQMP